MRHKPKQNPLAHGELSAELTGVSNFCSAEGSRQGWKMYRTTGPSVPENFWGGQEIFQVSEAK